MAMPDDEPVVDEQLTTDVTPSTETEAVETPAVETAVETPWYSGLGDEYSGLSQEAAQERIRYQLQESRRIQQEADGYKTLLLRQQQAEQSARHQAQQQSQQAAKPKRNVPEYDPAWLEGVTRDEKTNQLVAKPGFMMDLPAKIQAYAKWREDELNKFIHDPSAYLQEQMQDMIAQQSQQVFQSQFVPFQTQLATALSVNKWEEEYADILFEKGGRNAANPQYTWAGKQIVDGANKYLSMGLSHVQALDQALKDTHYNALMSGKIPTNGNGTNGHAVPNVNGREQALRVAAQNGQRKPSKQVPSETADRPRPRKSFQEIAMEGMAAIGKGPHDPIE